MIDNNKLDELMCKLKEGKIEVFDEIYELSKNVLYYSILGITKNISMAEDILQDTYLKVLESIQSYKPGSNALSYLFTIARNLAINVYNKNKKTITVDVYEYRNKFVDNQVSYNDSPMMKLMFETLNKKEMEIVILHIVNDMTYQEIANLLKKPLGPITWQFNNAMKKLKRKVGDKNE